MSRHADIALMITAGTVAVAAEGGLVTAYLAEYTSLSLALAAHLGMSALLVGVAAWLYRRGSRDPGFLLLVVATVMMGPFGAVGAGLGAGLRALFSLHPVPFEAWYTALSPTLETSSTQLLYERLVLRSGGLAARSTVTSFQDIMALGTVQQKQVVLTAIADKFRPEFASALRRALNNAEPAIRVQAATVSARIEAQFLDRSLQFRHRQAVAPDDPALLLGLARHHDAWADTGLLDKQRARSERLQALKSYERLAAVREGDLAIDEAIGRLLLHVDRPDRALLKLEAAAMRPGATQPARALHLACLYRLGRFAELRAAARRYWPGISASALPDEQREAARLWAGAVPARVLQGAEA